MGVVVPFACIDVVVAADAAVVTANKAPFFVTKITEKILCLEPLYFAYGTICVVVHVIMVIVISRCILIHNNVYAINILTTTRYRKTLYITISQSMSRRLLKTKENKKGML